MFELTCILCPNGCSLIVNYDADGNIKVTGNKCKRGGNFAFDEMACRVKIDDLDFSEDGPKSRSSEYFKRIRIKQTLYCRVMLVT